MSSRSEVLDLSGDRDDEALVPTNEACKDTKHIALKELTHYFLDSGGMKNMRNNKDPRIS